MSTDVNDQALVAYALWYVVAGLLLALSTALPGSTAGWRVANLVIGLGLAAWAGLALYAGVPLVISTLLIAVPFLLIARSVWALIRRRGTTRSHPGPDVR